MKRDFTINSLFFNSWNCRIYDCVNGLSDLRKNKVCTVISAHVSFKEDPARILRGMRIAGRLDFQFSSETSRAIQDLSSSIMTIPKARLMLEMNYMLSYGAVECTFHLIRKYRLLDILLPFQAAYLSDQMKGRSSDRDVMLMKLSVNLDKLLSAKGLATALCGKKLQRLALLAFHSALVSSPQDAQVIRAFAALLHFGSWESTMNFLEQDIGCHAPFVSETLGSSQTKLDNLMEQTMHLASLVNSSICTLTSLDALQQSVARYGEASQFSGVVFVSKTEGRRLQKIFEGLDSDLTSWLDRRRWTSWIQYRRLKDGVPSEVRFVLGKVILDTMNDELPCAPTEDAAVTTSPFGNPADGSHPQLSTPFQSY